MIRIAATIAAALFVAGCSTAADQVAPPSVWKTKSFAAARVTAVTPSNLCLEHDSAHGALIHLRGIPPPLGVLDDTHCLLQIRIERMSTAKFEEKLEMISKYLPPPGLARELRLFEASRHPTVARREGGPYAYYRLDRPCPNGDMLKMWAEVHTVAREGGEDDDAIVRRILDSVRCMEEGR